MCFLGPPKQMFGRWKAVQTNIFLRVWILSAFITWRIENIGFSGIFQPSIDFSTSQNSIKNSIIYSLWLTLLPRFRFLRFAKMHVKFHNKCTFRKYVVQGHRFLNSICGVHSENFHFKIFYLIFNTFDSRCLSLSHQFFVYKQVDKSPPFM